MENEKGYRPNVGIIIINPEKKVLLARRLGFKDAWQFPQGGVHQEETALEAMHRELYEELGLKPEEVEVLAESRHWFKYKLPERFIRYHDLPLVIGQKQKWFLLRLLVDEKKIALDCAEKPEFEEWKWVDYWYPVDKVIAFKRRVYRKILEEFARL